MPPIVKRIVGTAIAICRKCKVPLKRTYFYQPEDAAKNDTKCDCGGELDWEHSGITHNNVFPYVHPHLTGEGPVVVESLAHLRKLEKRYGVNVHAFSQDSVDSPKKLPVFRPGGRED